MKVFELESMDKSEMKRRLRDWDNQQWISEVKGKSSIFMYQNCKKEINEETDYDNTPASTVLFRARTNTLPIDERRRHVNEDRSCELCDAEVEAIKHFLLFCLALTETRSITALPQPYSEAFLFKMDSPQAK